MGLDARGFLLGPVIALRLGAAFVPVRKKGKLAGATVSVEYEKEYGLVNESTRIHTHLDEIETDPSFRTLWRCKWVQSREMTM